MAMVRWIFFSLLLICVSCVVQSQDSKHIPPGRVRAESVSHANEWFYRGRAMRGQPSAELRRRAYQKKLQMRAQRATPQAAAQTSLSTGTWIPLGPVPLASDATGTGTQDYRQVAGRATAVAIDPADASGNTVYIGGAQSGIWKSINAANATANSVTWIPLTDTQPTLSIGSIAIQPGNSDPAKSVILTATGEADNSGDSYFGLGILRSTDAGNTWSLIPTANNGALSFSGLGGTRIAFSSAVSQTNTVVSAMATTSEGLIDGAVTANTTRGLYTSRDAGQTWTYDALVDQGGSTDATSATSVVYNAAAAEFFAAVRYHGFYASPDGVTWTRLANQPGGTVLGTAACPAQSTSNDYACPIYRGEITVVPGRNEMYAWYISLGANGTAIDGGIWMSLNGGASWTSISDASIVNCGDVEGCGVEQAAYNLELLAVTNGSATDLYAGTINLYKCSITTANPTCASVPFMNLTHAYGCDPIAAPAHVHPNQHAMASMIPAMGSDSGNVLLYFANDGGVYRALNGVSGLATGSCAGTNQFDDLNQNLGPMTQFVAFSQHPTDANTILGGAQGNGFPASSQATTNASWINVLGGDGGINAIDPTATSNWYASNPDLPPSGLGIQLCSSGANCNDSSFDFVVTSNSVGGDDGGFYSPFVLDPHSSTAMVVGTCRVWRGPRTGGVFTALSPNFDTLGSGTCSGSEINQVRALATGGNTDSNGSSIIYATTNGLGPLEGPLSSPAAGRVWVTTYASGGVPDFEDVTGNGPHGNINPNQFAISSVATDPSDATAHTAYVTVMGFTGGAGHIWKTTNAGATWTDFTANLPDSPANAVVVYPPLGQVYVATDVGVFGSSTSTPGWTELGPNPTTNQAGFLPNVAVTGLGIFASGGQQLLRASTYGRGIWQFNLVITPDFQVAVSNSPMTIFAGQSAAFNGTVTAQNGYANSVTLSCIPGTTAPPNICAASPASLVPGSKSPFTVSVGGLPGDYSFSIQGAGSDVNHITHSIPVTLHLVSFGLTKPSPAAVTVPRGETSLPVTFQVTAAGSFNSTVTVSCTTAIVGATCTLAPGNTVSPTASVPVNMTATVAVPATTAAGSYSTTLQASTNGAPSTLTASFTLNVSANPDFVLSGPPSFPEVNAGSTGVSGSISIDSQDGFSSAVKLSCATTFSAGSCSVSPSSVSSFPAAATVTINGTNFPAGAYSVVITGIAGSTTHTLSIPFNVGDFSLTGPGTLSTVPGAQVSVNFKIASSFSYDGSLNAACDATALPGAMCTLTPVNPISLASGGTVTLVATINVPNSASAATYNIQLSAQDSTGAPNHTAVVALTVGQDFLVKSATPSQTVTAGQTSGPYNLTVQPVGSSFTGAVTLVCAGGLPAQAQCNFSPSGAITPGTSAVDIVMSIATKAGNAEMYKPGRRGVALYASWLVMPGLIVAATAARRTKKRMRTPLVSAVLLFPLVMSTLSCGGVSSSSKSGNGGTGTSPVTPAIYQVTVSGTSPGTAPDAGQSTVVTLVVN